MNMRRAARTALVAPLMIGGAAVVLAFGTGTVFAASSAAHASATVNTPRTSSGPHEHENVVCTNATIVAGGTCTVTFTDIKTSDEKHPKGNVCFSVSPTAAGTATPFTPPCSNITLVGGMYIATSMFNSNPNFCPTFPSATATIYATEKAENNQRHHFTETINCVGTGTTTSFTVPASPSPPVGGWLLGAMGVGLRS